MSKIYTQWLKFRKTFRGGEISEYLLYTDYEPITDDSIEDFVQMHGEWADGGENYGYTLYWDKVDAQDISLEVKLVKIKEYEDSIERRKTQIIEYHEIIALITKEIIDAEIEKTKK